MIKEILEKIINGDNLSVDEAYDAMNKIMSGQVNNSQISALLTSLKCKGETSEEIAGFAKAMRSNSIKINSPEQIAVDVCGTGGDNSGTFNISTAVAFVAAGTGLVVPKHGNRSITSKSGSADVLRELGVNVELTPEQSEAALKEVGIAFLFAPLYHPAMKYVMPVRRELAMKTVFNILGPLTNPASTKHQVIGTFNNKTANLMAEAASYLEMEKVCFVCTENKYDEILLTGESNVFEYSPTEGVMSNTLTSESFGYSDINFEDIKGDSPAVNAEILKKIFTSGKRDAAFKVVCANSALTLYVAGKSQNLIECVDQAEESILSGKALKKLNDLIEFGASV